MAVQRQWQSAFCVWHNRDRARRHDHAGRPQPVPCRPGHGLHRADPVADLCDAHGNIHDRSCPGGNGESRPPIGEAPAGEVAGQACIVAALAIGWRIGREFMDSRRSLAALALTSLVVFYNAGGDTFNHELALLPLVAAAALLFLRAVRSGQWLLWGLAGLAA